MRVRPGFTLIELLVAIVLVDVGLLALVAGSAVVLREVADSRARTAAVAAATDRIESLAARSCIATVGGSTSRSAREYWTVEALTGAREPRDSVLYLPPRGSA